MGILNHVMTGLADGVGSWAKMQHEQNLLDRQFEKNKELAQFKTQLEQQQQEHLIQLKSQAEINTTNTLREQQASRIGQAQEGILNQNMLKKANDTYEYTDPDTGASSPVTSVDELPDEDKQAFAPSDRDRLQAYIEAGIKTGDITPKEAASIYKSGESDLTRLMLGEQRALTMAQIAAGNNDTKKLVASIMAASRTEAANIRAEAKNGRDKEDRVLVHQFLSQFDRKIANNEQEIRSLRSSLKDADPAQAKEINAQINQLKGEQKNLMDAQIEYAREVGVKVPSVMDNLGRGKKDEPVKPVVPDENSKRPPLSSFRR